VHQPQAVIASFASQRERIFASIVGGESMMESELMKGFFVAIANIRNKIRKRFTDISIGGNHMQHFQNRQEWIEAIIAWSKSAHTKDITAAVIEDLHEQTDGLEQSLTPVMGYISALGAIYRWGGWLAQLISPYDLGGQMPPDCMSDFKDISSQIEQIFPRAFLLSKEFDYEEFESPDPAFPEPISSYPDGVFSKAGVAYLSHPSVVGIGCGHYRMRKEKVFHGVLGFTDIMPDERKFAEWAAAPFVPTICGHTQGCGKELSVCDCCGVLICDECKEATKNPNEEATKSSVNDLYIGGKLQSYCPFWGPTDLENWEDYVHRPDGESMDMQPKSMVYGHPNSSFTTHLELLNALISSDEYLFRTLNYLYPPVRARCAGHPLFNPLWSTTHPTTVPNRGPGEIYTIHDEDCCNDDGRKHFAGVDPISGDFVKFE
jgi:hypothetical protein